jgi:hypothetical protein
MTPINPGITYFGKMLGGAIIILLVICTGCKPSTPAPIPTSALPTLIPTSTLCTSLSDVIQQILANPGDFEGHDVVIIGYFRGWDLLGEASGTVPVTRSDWVIKDKNGAMYVTGGGGELNLSPGSKEDTNTVIRLTGVIRLTKTNQPYVEAAKVELVE